MFRRSADDRAAHGQDPAGEAWRRARGQRPPAPLAPLRQVPPEGIGRR